MNYPDETHMCSLAGAAYRAHQRYRRSTLASHHFTQGMDQVVALTELQTLLSDKLGTHVSLGAIGYFAQATGKESLEQLAQHTHIPLTHLRRHKKEVYHTIIPSLRVMNREVQRLRVGLDIHAHE
ncbi:hypothetical protein FJZ22_02060 [Candidatus Pacearchaeota archaeon]|nr:hypothetical protein [Candidatus Pacearchaeota archaeon]